jgi:hypothetical protein
LHHGIFFLSEWALLYRVGPKLRNVVFAVGDAAAYPASSLFVTEVSWPRSHPEGIPPSPPSFSSSSKLRPLVLSKRGVQWISVGLAFISFTGKEP